MVNQGARCLLDHQFKIGEGKSMPPPSAPFPRMTRCVRGETAPLRR